MLGCGGTQNYMATSLQRAANKIWYFNSVSEFKWQLHQFLILQEEQDGSAVSMDTSLSAYSHSVLSDGAAVSNDDRVRLLQSANLLT